MRVLDRRGFPLAAAVVSSPGGLANTEADGFAWLPFLAATDTVQVEAEGYIPARWTVANLGPDLRWAETATQLGRARLVTPCPARWCIEVLLAPQDVRAIYIPMGLLAAPRRFWELIQLVERSPVLNGVVIDVKGDYGLLAWDSQVPLAREMGNRFPTPLNLADVVADLKRRGIYTIARFVTFKDDPLATHRPQWAVRRGDGTVWRDGEGLGWANPFREEVWEYNLALLEEVAQMGFDEIQLDYIRFPSDGNISAIVYAEENTRETRTAAIREFMRRFAERLGRYPVRRSADVFGLTLWVVPGEDMNIGQRVEDIAPYVDFLSPMIYPSTFIPGNLGYPAPDRRPYEVIYRSVLQARTRVPPHVRVRPWLQAYWYDLPEMQIQRLAAEDAKSDGWMYWNAGGSYPAELFGPLPPRNALWRSVYNTDYPGPPAP